MRPVRSKCENMKKKGGEVSSTKHRWLSSKRERRQKGKEKGKKKRGKGDKEKRRRVDSALQ
jgi:hypothetical protein